MKGRKNYLAFSEEEFMNDEYFQDWVIDPNPERERFWNEFNTLNPDRRSTVETAAKMLKALRFREEWPAAEKIERSLTQAYEAINSITEKAIVMENSALLQTRFRRWL